MSQVTKVVWLGESGGGELVNENRVGGVRLLIDTGDRTLGLWLGVPWEPWEPCGLQPSVVNGLCWNNHLI